MKCFWINVDTHTVRRNFMETQLLQRNIPNQRIPAVTPDRLPTVQRPTGCSASDLIYSCLLSHLAALQQGVSEGLPYFLIMEDDAQLLGQLAFEDMISTAPPGWQVLQLNTVNPNALLALAEARAEGAYWTRWNPVHWGTAAYIISREGSLALLRTFLTNGYDFSAIKAKDIPADKLLYKYTNSYTLTYPAFVPHIEDVGFLHPQHFPLHKSCTMISHSLLQDRSDLCPSFMKLAASHSTPQ